MKYIRVPDELTLPPFLHRSLNAGGFSIVESCTHTQRSKGSMFLEEHLLLYVREGQNVMTHGSRSYIVHENEMLLLKKATLVEYDKTGSETSGRYDSILFFLKDEFLQDFLRIAKIDVSVGNESVKVEVKPVKERLKRFFESVVPYFSEPENVDEGLLKIKMLELLYDIAATDKNLLQQLMQMRKPVKSNLAEIMEANFANPVTIEQLAYLSGRSLATFKRDFSAVYNMPPSDWIRHKRLNKAKEFLHSTDMSVTDICYALGFENPSHFSRIFKSHFGHTPLEVRQSLQIG